MNVRNSTSSHHGGDDTISSSNRSTLRCPPPSACYPLPSQPQQEAQPHLPRLLHMCLSLLCLLSDVKRFENSIWKLFSVMFNFVRITVLFCTVSASALTEPERDGNVDPKLITSFCLFSSFLPMLSPALAD
jgi:hypothetical protein